jgi:dethiobiotin synthetase
MNAQARGQGPGARGFFVTGTDTGVGKTLVATAILRLWADQGLRVAGYKPVAAGCEVTDGVATNADARALLAASTVPVSYPEVNPYALTAAIAPHLAAEDEGIEIDLGKLVAGYEHLAGLADRVMVEGAGGWLVPLDGERTLADLVVALQIPVIMVVGVRLGCISHASLTADAIAASGVPLAGWVSNQVSPDMPEARRNIDTLRGRLDAPLLGCIPFQDGDAPDPASSLDLGSLSI